MTITLTWQEVGQGAWTGIQRQMHALKDGRANVFGFDGDDWGIHIEGACGEIAAAKAMNRYWSASVNTFKNGGDVGQIQVRTRSRADYDLLIRDNDRDGDVFVLVTGKIPNFCVRGWIVGLDGKKDVWRKGHGGRPPAWFVPQSALQPIEALEL